MKKTNSNLIGYVISLHRNMLKMTKEDYGKQYHITSTSIYAIEQGIIRPRLDLWLKISKDIRIQKINAILMWIKEELSEEHSSQIGIIKVNGITKIGDLSRIKVRTKK